MKKEWVKPEIRFTTDPDIILGCLYEVYGQEKQGILAGARIRHTMIFLFLKMLSDDIEEGTRYLEILHKRLWRICQEEPGKQEFVQWGQKILATEREGESDG